MITYDGSHDDPHQHGPSRPWRDPVTRSRLAEVTFRQRRQFWEPAALNTSDGRPDDVTGFLLTEGEPQPIGGDLLEWTRIYADLPDYRFEPGDTVAVAQSVSLEGGIYVLRELPILTTGITAVDYLYGFELDGGVAAIPLITPTRSYVDGATVYTISGTTFPVEGVPWTAEGVFPENHIVLEQSSVRRWREGGDIFERRTLLVNLDHVNLGAALIPPP